MEPKAVDYKQRFRDAEVRIRELETENQKLTYKLQQVQELAGWIHDLTGDSSDG